MIESRYKKRFSLYSIENPEVLAKSQEPTAAKDLSFILKLFKKFSRVHSVLDVGCGVGSHVDALREKGYKSIGVDANPKMIEYAKRRYPNSDFKVQDMRLLNLNKSFDAIICIHSIIVFNRTNQEVLQTLKRFNKHIKKGGLLVVDVSNPISYLQKRKFKNCFVNKEKDITKFGVYEVITDNINERNQTMVNDRVFYTMKGNKKVGTYHRESRIFFPQELAFFLEQAGFKVLDMFSAEALSKMTFKDKILDKRRLMIVARKQ